MRAFIFAATLCMPAVTAAAANFTVTSSDFHNGGTIPTQNVASGCGGGNQSPSLTWSGEPAGTQSFAVTMYDPDAPTGSGWWHWTVFNLPPSVHSLPENAGSAQSAALPQGAGQGRVDSGVSNYSGPCPPVGDKPHRYIITVYAIKVAKLALDDQSSGAKVGFNMHFNSIAAARTVGRFGRQH